MNKLQELSERISRLSADQQAFVEKLVERLESGCGFPMTLDEAIDEFEREHPELLRLLAH